MSTEHTSSNICETIATAIRERVVSQAPGLLALFDLYAGELRFGRSLIDDNLKTLPKGAAILEIGAGSLLLSCCLCKEGYSVTALEPIGDGFSHFAQLQALVLAYANEQGIRPSLLQSSGEQLEVESAFDFAFSVNVMEHVGDVSKVLTRVYRALRPGAPYRFVCPNYAFPYEPHFNVPTLLNRSLTRLVMWRWMRNSTQVVDPAGTWQSLNWITVRGVRRICREADLPTPEFDRTVFAIFIERAFSDSGFQQRRGRVLVALVTFLRRAGFLGLIRFIPLAVLPVMDCSIVRPRQP